MTRRFVLVALFLALTLQAPAAQAHPAHGPCFNRWFTEIQPRFGAAVVHKRAHALTTCVANAVGFPGGPRMMRCIEDRESGAWPWAHSWNYSSWGLMQLNRTYWPAWLHYVPYRWFVHHPPPITNPRANLLTAALLAHRSGLSPWGGRC